MTVFFLISFEYDSGESAKKLRQIYNEGFSAIQQVAFKYFQANKSQ